MAADAHASILQSPVENVNEAYQALRKRSLTPEVTLVSIARAEPLARYLRYEAQNPIQILCVQKPLVAAEAES